MSMREFLIKECLEIARVEPSGGGVIRLAVVPNSVAVGEAADKKQSRARRTNLPVHSKAAGSAASGAGVNVQGIVHFP
jgi:hypothetical protein